VTTAEPHAKPHAKPRTKRTRKCQYCGTRFAFERSTARFCSDGCRWNGNYHRDRREHRGHLRTSASHEWHTPAGIVDAARHVLGGIELDPASCEAANRTVRADRYYTEREDGLAQPWRGTCWINPPYGRLAPLFARKFAGHFPHDVPRAILLLANHHLSTKWFLCLSALEPVTCMVSGRVPFGGSASQPPHGSVILGFGVDVARFREAFSPHGWVR
jgi:hypothetical protein